MPREVTQIPRRQYVEDLHWQTRDIAEAAAVLHRRIHDLWEWQMENKLPDGEQAPEVLNEAIREMHHKCNEAVQAAGGLDRLMEWLDSPARSPKALKKATKG